MTTSIENSSLALLKKQRSHLLLVLSDAASGRHSEFLKWYRGAYRQAVSAHPQILSANHFEPHEVDITAGRCAPLPLRYLGIYEISIDGAEAAASLIEQVNAWHRQESAAQAPATWLYYPASEKVGRPPARRPSLLTIAFANGVPGKEAEFREWYATRHIRHAMQIPALVSGQFFERTQFQTPGALEARFSAIAVYEQEGSPEDILNSFATLPPGALDFPALDLSEGRFAESVYRPL